MKLETLCPFISCPNRGLLPSPLPLAPKAVPLRFPFIKVRRVGCHWRDLSSVERPTSGSAPRTPVLSRSHLTRRACHRIRQSIRCYTSSASASQCRVLTHPSEKPLHRSLGYSGVALWLFKYPRTSFTYELFSHDICPNPTFGILN